MPVVPLAGFRRQPAFVWWAAASSSAIAFFATAKGPGLSSDSVIYLSTGVNLAHSGELATLDGSSLTVFPPGMSVLAASGELIGVGAQPMVRAVECVCAAVVVVLAHVLMRRLGMRTSVRAIATAFVACSPFTLSMSKMAWSELPFIVVTLAALVLLGDVWRSGRASPVCIGWLAVLCWAAFSLRYAGLVLIGTTCVVLLLGSGVPRRQRVTQVVAFCALASAAPLAWMVRNQSVDGTWLGPRGASPDGPVFVAKRILATLGSWCAPGVELSEKMQIVVGSVALVATAALVVLVVTTTRRSAVDWSQLRSHGGPTLVFVMIYVPYLSAAQLTTAIDPIDSRLMGAVYVPLVLMWALGISRVLDAVAAMRRATAVRSLLLALAAVALGSQVWATADDARVAHTHGVGFNATWKNSELGVLTKSTVNSGPSTVFTNNTDLLWAATGLRQIQHAPRTQVYRGRGSEGELEEFAQAVRCASGRVVLAMFFLGEPVYTVEQMSQLLDVVPVTTVQDGTLYELTAKGVGDGVSTVCSPTD